MFVLASLDHSDLENVCPVLILSFVSKIVEKVILSQLFSHLSTNQLFSLLQSVYRHGHSTETALRKVSSGNIPVLCTLHHFLPLVLYFLFSSFKSVPPPPKVCRFLRKGN